MPGVSGLFGGRKSLLLKTGQTVAYHVGDDGDLERGLSRGYVVLNAGGYAGTTSIDVPHYAANTISFTAPNTVSDAAGLLAGVKTGDTVRIRGSASNDGTYTVAGGGVAGSFTVNEAIANEAAARYVTIYKRVAHTNACVFDQRTRLIWQQTQTSGYKIGQNSDGLLEWYDAARVFGVHPAAADLYMYGGSAVLRIVGGAGEVDRYNRGDIIVCTGFANPSNNLPGYPINSVMVSGADLDLWLEAYNNVLVTEAAGGARTISKVCDSVFGYAAAANHAAPAFLSLFGDWRVPSWYEFQSIMRYLAPNSLPDPAYFPGWPNAIFYASTTRPNNTAQAAYVEGGSFGASDVKTTPHYTALVRG